jgi:hypothetical protein
MTPEAPGNLVVLDLNFRGGTLVGKVEQIVPPQGPLVGQWIRVRFHEPPEQGFFGVGDGVAFASAPKRFKYSKATVEAKIPTAGSLLYHWPNVAQGDGLMLVMVLPPGYTLATDECDPFPGSAKEFHGRLAVYFKPAGGHGKSVDVKWQLKPLSGDLNTEVERIVAEIAGNRKPNGNAGVFVDTESHESGDKSLSGSAYALIALVAALLGLGLLLIFVYQVPQLIASGVQNQVFYILLIPWGLTSAAFLFGAMRSYARFSYKHLGSALELGGPVVLFCLVLAGGFKLVPAAAESFDLAVRAHGADSPLITSGQVTLELPGLPHANIGQDGEANFKGLSLKLKGKAIKVLPKVDGYEEKWLTPTVDGNVLKVELEKANPTFLQRATLVPPPIKGQTVQIRVEGQKIDVAPDELGGFTFTTSGRVGDRVSVEAFVNQKLASSGHFVLGTQAIEIHWTSPSVKPKR